MQTDCASGTANQKLERNPFSSNCQTWSMRVQIYVYYFFFFYKMVHARPEESIVPNASCRLPGRTDGWWKLETCPHSLGNRVCCIEMPRSNVAIAPSLQIGRRQPNWPLMGSGRIGQKSDFRIPWLSESAAIPQSEALETCPSDSSSLGSGTSFMPWYWETQ